MSSTTSTLTTHSASASAPAARLCQHPRCTRELSPANRSGYCVAHRDLHRSHRKISSNGNGVHARDVRAPAAKSNGSGKNGREDRLATSVIARRVKALLGAVELPIDCVLEIIPDQDKKVFVENWLLAREGAA